MSDWIWNAQGDLTFLGAVCAMTIGSLLALGLTDDVFRSDFTILALSAGVITPWITSS